MKKLFVLVGVIIFFLSFVFLNSYNQSGDDEKQTKIKIGATIFPLYDIVLQIGGDDIEALLILPPGASEHTFEPSPSTLRALIGTHTVFSVGLGLDGWLSGLVDSVGVKSVVPLFGVVTTIPFEDNILLAGGEEDDHEDEGDTDPHYWLDPLNGKFMASAIAMELSRIDPDNADDYVDRLEIFSGTLDNHIQSWRSDLLRIKDKPFLTFHDAFSYLINFGELSYRGSIEPFPGKEPTPRYLARLQKIIQDEGVIAIFTEPQLSLVGINSFAEDNRVKIGELDPLGGIEGRDSYQELIDYNVQELVRVLISVD